MKTSLKTSLSAVFFAALVAAPVAAQARVMTFPDDRKSTTALFMDADGLSFVCIQYSQPDWRPEYEAMMTGKGRKTFRLGKNFWTTLDATLDIEIAGKRVPHGHYFLALVRDGGRLHLALVDPKKAARQKTSPAAADTYPVMATMPLSESKVDEKADKLVISLEKKGDDLELAIHWGNHRVTAPVKVAGKATSRPAKGRDSQRRSSRAPSES